MVVVIKKRDTQEGSSEGRALSGKKTKNKTMLGRRPGKTNEELSGW